MGTWKETLELDKSVYSGKNLIIGIMLAIVSLYCLIVSLMKSIAGFLKLCNPGRA